jgi:hypothetical protein
MGHPLKLLELRVPVQSDDRFKSVWFGFLFESEWLMEAQHKPEAIRHNYVTQKFSYVSVLRSDFVFMKRSQQACICIPLVMDKILHRRKHGRHCTKIARG